eukprot:1216778-Amphidinium_carterae.1
MQLGDLLAQACGITGVLVMSTCCQYHSLEAEGWANGIDILRAFAYEAFRRAAIDTHTQR